MKNRSVSVNALAFSVASLICTAALAQSPSTDPNRPSQPSSSTPSAQQPPRTPSGTNSNNSGTARRSLDSLEGQWNVTMRVTGMGGKVQDIKGTATRTWMLDESVLREDFRVTDVTSTGSKSGTTGSNNTGSGTSGSGTGGIRDSGSTAPAGQQPGSQTGNVPAVDQTGSGDDNRDRDMDRDRDTASLGDISREFEGLGLFSFDPSTSQISHVWADSMSSGMCLSLGNFDASSKTITFTQQAGHLDKNRPGNVMGSGTGTSGTRDTTGNVNNDRNDQDRPATGGTTGSTPPRSGSTTGTTNNDGAVVTLRMVSDTQHVVTMTTPTRNGQASRTYEITYVKQGTTGSTPSTPATDNNRNRP